MNKEKAEETDLPLTLRDSHMHETYSRWADMQNNTKIECEIDEYGSHLYPEDWYFEQCGDVLIICH